MGMVGVEEEWTERGKVKKRKTEMISGLAREDLTGRTKLRPRSQHTLMT